MRTRSPITVVREQLSQRCFFDANDDLSGMECPMKCCASLVVPLDVSGLDIP